MEYEVIESVDDQGRKVTKKVKKTTTTATTTGQAANEAAKNAKPPDAAKGLAAAQGAPEVVAAEAQRMADQAHRECELEERELEVSKS